MVWEATLWIALGVLAPAVRRVNLGRLEGAALPLSRLSPWLHGVFLPYVALVSGAVFPADMGIFGRHGWVGWAVAAGGCLLVLASVARLRRKITTHVPWASPTRSALDEPRWALYRAAGALWTGSFWLGALGGLAAAMLEWGLANAVWRSQNRLRDQVCTDLMRLSASSLLFSLSGNLWLSLLTQAGIAAIIRQRPAR